MLARLCRWHIPCRFHTRARTSPCSSVHFALLILGENVKKREEKCVCYMSTGKCHWPAVVPSTYPIKQWLSGTATERYLLTWSLVPMLEVTIVLLESCGTLFSRIKIHNMIQNMIQNCFLCLILPAFVLPNIHVFVDPVHVTHFPSNGYGAAWTWWWHRVCMDGVLVDEVRRQHMVEKIIKKKRKNICERVRDRAGRQR